MNNDECSYLYPSEIARLIRGYLLDQKLYETERVFLSESPLLRETKQLIDNGFKVPTKLLGNFQLEDVLQGRVQCRLNCTPLKVADSKDVGCQARVVHLCPVVDSSTQTDYYHSSSAFDQSESFLNELRSLDIEERSVAVQTDTRTYYEHLDVNSMVDKLCNNTEMVDELTSRINEIVAARLSGALASPCKGSAAAVIDDSSSLSSNPDQMPTSSCDSLFCGENMDDLVDLAVKAFTSSEMIDEDQSIRSLTGSPTPMSSVGTSETSTALNEIQSDQRGILPATTSNNLKQSASEMNGQIKTVKIAADGLDKATVNLFGTSRRSKSTAPIVTQSQRSRPRRILPGPTTSFLNTANQLAVVVGSGAALPASVVPPSSDLLFVNPNPGSCRLTTPQANAVNSCQPVISSTPFYTLPCSSVSTGASTAVISYPNATSLPSGMPSPVIACHQEAAPTDDDVEVSRLTTPGKAEDAVAHMSIPATSADESGHVRSLFGAAELRSQPNACETRRRSRQPSPPPAQPAVETSYLNMLCTPLTPVQNEPVARSLTPQRPQSSVAVPSMLPTTTTVPTTRPSILERKRSVTPSEVGFARIPIPAAASPKKRPRKIQPEPVSIDFSNGPGQCQVCYAHVAHINEHLVSVHGVSIPPDSQTGITGNQNKASGDSSTSALAKTTTKRTGGHTSDIHRSRNTTNVLTTASRQQPSRSCRVNNGNTSLIDPASFNKKSNATFTSSPDSGVCCNQNAPTSSSSLWPICSPFAGKDDTDLERFLDSIHSSLSP